MERRIRSGWHFLGTSWMPPDNITCRITPESPESISWLPVKLVQDTFQYLDSVNRTRCRRVCSLWDIVAEMTKEVWVTFSSPDFRYNEDCAGPEHREWRRSAYKVGMCLWKTIAATTVWVIIASAVESDGYPFLGDCLRIIKWVRQEQQSRQKIKVILHRFHWYVQDVAYMMALATACADAAAVVQTLTWKDCRFTIGYSWTGVRHGISVALGSVDVDADRFRFLHNLHAFLEGHLLVSKAEFAALLPHARLPQVYMF
ncbi:uncharacterized protein LOC129598098 isoform X2 [Paramacrobiotus metropolitanus]|nr:uncharacterized protein LOC129598098 isoform X2 [Paramacrobiotus metropolitanus]